MKERAYYIIHERELWQDWTKNMSGNFGCVYCFEKENMNSARMDEETQNALVEYVKKMFLQKESCKSAGTEENLCLHWILLRI